MIDWKPIAEMPDHLKDGRDVLIAKGDRAAVASWDDSYVELWECGWHDCGDIGWGGMCGVEPTYFAEINYPEVKP